MYRRSQVAPHGEYLERYCKEYRKWYDWCMAMVQDDWTPKCQMTWLDTTKCDHLCYFWFGTIILNHRPHEWDIDILGVIPLPRHRAPPRWFHFFLSQGITLPLSLSWRDIFEKNVCILYTHTFPHGSIFFLHPLLTKFKSKNPRVWWLILEEKLRGLLAKLFNKMDDSHTGTLTLSDIEKHFDDEEVRALFETLEPGNSNEEKGPQTVGPRGFRDSLGMKNKPVMWGL